MKRDVLVRLEARTERDPNSGCWLWNGAVNSSGYGVISIRGRQVATHRTAWSAVNGIIPPGMFICHHCDTPRCIRPDHLFLGTAADNSYDRFLKVCRGRRPPNRSDWVHPRSPLRYLTIAQVREIQRRWHTQTERLAHIAADVGVSDHAARVALRVASVDELLNPHTKEKETDG